MLALLLAPATTWAHAASKSYLILHVDGQRLDGRLTVSLIDIALALKLDIRAAPGVLRGAVAARRDEVLAYAQQGLVMLVNGERRPFEYGGMVDATRDGEEVLILELSALAPASIEALDIGYTLFFEDDAQHECLSRVEWRGEGSTDVIFRLGVPHQRLERSAGSVPGFLQFLRSGVWHIWTGYDHVLFLIALLLPAVFVRAHRGWTPAPALAPAILRVLSIVTAFTLAHSATLACATLGWIRLPEQLVESAIAASVFIAAAGNLLPATAGFGGPWLAFAFGLLHGFGFAGVLSELVPDSSHLWRPLVAFNAGVELGQLAIVAVFFSIAWMLRGTRFYRDGVLKGGSAAVCACATAWFFMRAF